MNNKRGLTFLGQSFLAESDRKCFRIKLNMPANPNGEKRLGMGKVQIVENWDGFESRVLVQNRQQNILCHLGLFRKTTEDKSLWIWIGL